MFPVTVRGSSAVTASIGNHPSFCLTPLCFRITVSSSSTPSSGRRDSNPQPPPWQGGILPLSYARLLNIQKPTGFEPALTVVSKPFGLPSYFYRGPTPFHYSCNSWRGYTHSPSQSLSVLCCWVESNHRPPVYQTGALNQLSYSNIIYTEPSRYLGMDVSIPWGPQLLTFRRPFGLLKQHHCLSTSVFVGRVGFEPTNSEEGRFTVCCH